jgi:hypothetical protein
MKFLSTLFRSLHARLISIVVLALSLLTLTLRAAPDQVPAPTPTPAGPVAGAPAPTPTPAATAPAPLSPNVTISITVVPSRMATVTWGKQRLGLIKPRGALVVQRPRDSGPLDLIVRADGYLPVHTRAYTFNDTRLSVRLTALDQKATLLGYREELPPPDAGAPLLSPEVPLESVP